MAWLEEGRLAVHEIAEELGYSATPHFTRFFRERAGMPPTVYREMGHSTSDGDGR